MKWTVLAIPGLILSTLVACAPPTMGVAQGYNPPEPPADAGTVVPTHYRPVMAAAIKQALREPDSVRDPLISEPFRRWMGAGYRYVVCARFNARNAYGGYTGASDVMAVFVSGKLNTIDYADHGECRPALYGPFPEILGKRR